VFDVKDERVFGTNTCPWYGADMPAPPSLSDRQRRILEFIDAQVRERGFPPSVREIGAAVGLTSTSTVHTHLRALERKGYLRRDPTKPRAMELHFEPASGAISDRRRVRHVPLVGHVAAGTGVIAAEQVEEVLPLPEDFTGSGPLFMLRVRGDSMTGAGILDGDYVVLRRQDTAEPHDIVVAGLPGEEATVKTYLRRRAKVVLRPENPAFEELVLDPSEVVIYGRVVTVLRRL
jgi:repressor LexA